MSDYLEVVVAVFDETDQRASVRRSLTVAKLIQAILSEFQELDDETPEHYGLYPEGGGRPLERNKTLADQGVQPGDRLVFSWARDPFRQLRRPLTEGVSFALQEVTTQVLFPIEWQPALIGRPDRDPAHNELLAVNLEYLSGSRRVSRRHAQITERAGVWYLEALAPMNPTLLKGQRLSLGREYQIHSGDAIDLGNSGITLTAISQVKRIVRKDTDHD
jgi:pSer/pThr/pTyr-binding forkhead associated (FHA) protein